MARQLLYVSVSANYQHVSGTNDHRTPHRPRPAPPGSARPRRSLLRHRPGTDRAPPRPRTAPPGTAEAPPGPCPDPARAPARFKARNPASTGPIRPGPSIVDKKQGNCRFDAPLPPAMSCRSTTPSPGPIYRRQKNRGIVEQMPAAPLSPPPPGPFYSRQKHGNCRSDAIWPPAMSCLSTTAPIRLGHSIVDKKHVNSRVDARWPPSPISPGPFIVDKKHWNCRADAPCHSQCHAGAPQPHPPGPLYSRQKHDISRADPRLPPATVRPGPFIVDKKNRGIVERVPLANRHVMPEHNSPHPPGPIYSRQKGGNSRADASCPPATIR